VFFTVLSTLQHLYKVLISRELFTLSWMNSAYKIERMGAELSKLFERLGYILLLDETREASGERQGNDPEEAIWV